MINQLGKQQQTNKLCTDTSTRLYSGWEGLDRTIDKFVQSTYKTAITFTVCKDSMCRELTQVLPLHECPSLTIKVSFWSQRHLHHQHTSTQHPGLHNEHSGFFFTCCFCFLLSHQQKSFACLIYKITLCACVCHLSLQYQAVARYAEPRVLPTTPSFYQLQIQFQLRLIQVKACHSHTHFHPHVKYRLHLSLFPPHGM